jgi:hypothetical protein
MPEISVKESVVGDERKRCTNEVDLAHGLRGEPSILRNSFPRAADRRALRPPNGFDLAHDYGS